jgi:hypothetical protein
MTNRPPVELRRFVVERANNQCEYCLISQDLVASSHQIDHVIAEKHGGPTEAENLALSCAICNLRKGSDISSIEPETGLIVPLFNPRQQSWTDHFVFDDAIVVGLTATGRTTVAFLRLNSSERIAERAAFIEARVRPFYRGPGKPR